MARSHADTVIMTLPMPIWPAETYPLEPVQGWIHRAAERNYAFSTDAFIDSLGLSGRDWDYDELLKIVQQLPIDSYSEIEHCTSKRCSEGYEICGYRVPFRFISKSERRVCPQCLAEGRYIRNWFDIVPVATCPHHNVALVGGLPNDPLDWRHTEVGWTRSGLKVGAEHGIPQTASDLDRFIVGTLSGAQPMVPDDLVGVSLGEVLTASICVGKLARSDVKYPSTTEDVRQFCQSGFEPLIGGSEAVIDFLRQASWLQSGTDTKKLRSRLDGVPAMLTAIRDEHLRNLVGESFIRARLRNGVATPSGRLSKYDGEDDLLNLKGAACRLGLSRNTLSRLLDRLSIKSQRCEQSRVHRLTREQIGAVQQYIDSTLTATEASDLLGCEPRDLKSLVNRKLLKMEFCKGGQYHYSRKSIDSLISELSKKTRAPSIEIGDTIDVFAKKIGMSLPEAVSRILRGQNLIVAGYDPMRPVFTDLKVVDIDMLHGDACAKQKPSAGIRPSAQIRDAITHAQAAARLGTDSRGLKMLVTNSLISLTADDSGKERICPESLDSFVKRYVKASSYATILGCHSTSALKLLRAAGVRPINDWEAAGPKFVDPEEVKRLAGFDRPQCASLASWHDLEAKIIERLAAHAVPATARVTGVPAIEVRATSGRWSFLIEEHQESGHYRLTSNFTANRQPGRLKRVVDASIDPSDIWPGANLKFSDDGGFVLIDEVIQTGSESSGEASLIHKVVVRAHEIHRLL